MSAKTSLQTMTAKKKRQFDRATVTPWDWRELTNREREEAIEALVMGTVEGEPVPEIRTARCHCGREQATPGPPRFKFLSEHGWRWQRAQHVPLDFSGSAGAARWLCPACVREAMTYVEKHGGKVLP